MLFSLLPPILLASLAGSLHCAGMCGAFVAFACGGADGGPATGGRRLALQGAYHGGRLLTYALLGALAGAAGNLLDLAAGAARLGHAAALVAGGLLLAFGLLALGRAAGLSIPGLRASPRWAALLAAGHRRAAACPPVARAAAIGLLTTLLPCGWLWLFALSAAATGSAPMGAAVMAAFWLGTVPVLAALGFGAHRLRAWLGPHRAWVGAAAVCVLGLWLVVARDHLDPRRFRLVPAVGAAAPPAADAPCPCCSAAHADAEAPPAGPPAPSPAP